MNQRFSKWVTGIAAAAAVVGVVSVAPTALAATTIQETGSSLLYPLFNGEWVPTYESANPDIKITAAATGSGAGISQAIAGTVQIGASDAYMADAQMQQSPSMLNIPLAISAQQIMYNLPGLKQSQHIHLNGTLLAKIYGGSIRKWNDPQIQKLNKGIKLPNHAIIPIVRSDGSGDTFLFTNYLTDSNIAWKRTIAFGTSVSWPALSTEISEKGNSGIVQGLASNPYSISYVGISYLATAKSQGIGWAALQNKVGQYVLPTNATIAAAAKGVATKTPKDERISLVNAPGKNAYPIINYEYAIVNAHQKDDAAAVKKFLNWAVSPKGGNQMKYLAPVNFLPLPTGILKLSQAQINKITH